MTGYRHDMLHGCPRCAISGIVLKLRLGEAPEDTPAMLDVNARMRPPATAIDGGAIDRIVSRVAGGVRAARLHVARANAGQGEQVDHRAAAPVLVQFEAMARRLVGRQACRLRPVPRLL